MQGNDLSNEVTPRIFLVWEGLIATPSALKQDQKRSFLSLPRRSGKAAATVKTFIPNEVVCRKIWDITWRFNYQIDALTWLGSEYVPHIEEWLDKEDLPVRQVLSYEPNHLARKLITMPYVAAIYDPDPSHKFLFGGKTRIVDESNYTSIGMF